MVVEDDDNTRAMYQAHFDEWDLPVDAILQASAIEALLDTSLVNPQVLITDLRMPGIDGVAMLRQLSAHPLYAHLAVIVITGLNEEDIKAYGELPPGTHVLQKPVDMGWLKGYFQAMLSLRTPAKKPAIQIDIA
jgi:DNA-binding response OmpR family regulator